MRDRLTSVDHRVMTTEPETPIEGVRASNAEREAFAATISTASEEGRITVTEADERLVRIYAATFREELPTVVADLPRESWPINIDQHTRHDQHDPYVAVSSTSSTSTRRRGNEWSAALTVHVAFVAMIAFGAIAAWTHSRVPFFWPAFPMFWLGLSVFVHYRIRQRWRAGRVGFARQQR